MPRPQDRELRSWLVAASGLRAHVFVLTSGSTAASTADHKWVALSKQAVLAAAEGSNRHLSCTAKDVWLHCLPDFHVGGMGIWARAELAGSRIVRMDSHWDAREFTRRASANRATLASLVPAQVHDLVAAGLNAPSSLRAVLAGGGSLAEALHAEAIGLGWPLLRTYGMTEAASQVATEPTVGGTGNVRYKVLPHLEASSAEDGRLRVRGASLLTGYISLNAEGKPCLWDPKDAEGWFNSEDYGHVSEGWVRFEGRASERLKIGGEITNLTMLSALILKETRDLIDHRQCSLLAVPDERLEWVVGLATESTADPEAVSLLVERFNASVLPFERIRRQFVVDRIPRTELGKVKRAELLALVSSP